MRDDISNKLIAYAKKNNTIESMFYIENENYSSFCRVYSVVNDIIIGKLEDELVGLFDDIILVNRTKDEFSFKKSKIPYTSINIYRKDNSKISESIISSEYADGFIKTLPSNVKFIYNKPGFERLELNKDFKYDRPKEYELLSTIRNFFASAIEVSMYIKEKDELAASLKMEQLRSYLLSVINFYIRERYSYTKDMGYDGQNLKSSLELDVKENYLLSYHHEDFIDIYDSLFRSCVLFRRIAMGLCNTNGFDYPKQVDVEAMKLLRSNYKKLESFLS